MKLRRLLSVVALSFLLGMSLVQADVKPPRGFDKKVYDASMALYGTLPAHLDENSMGGMALDQTHFLCTVTAFRKVKGGYVLIGAGHCTSANPELPEGLVYSVAENIGAPRLPVQLLKAVLVDKENDYTDFAVYLLKTDKVIPVIPLGDEEMVEVGSDTVDVNFSLGEKMTKQLTKGYVASQIANPPSKIAGFFLVQQFDSHGASGSAVVSEKTHQIIGLVIAGYDGSTTPTITEPMTKIRSAVSSILMQLPQ